MKLAIILATWLIAGVGAGSIQAQDTTQYQQSQQLLTPTTAAWVGSIAGQNGGLTGGGNGVAQAKGGTLLGLDGRIIYVRSPHSAFNAKIQGWGSEVVKKGMTLRWKYIKELDVDSEQVGYYHDEWLAEPDEDCVDAEIECSQRAVKESGEYYNLSVPMTGESKCGKNWRETH